MVPARLGGGQSRFSCQGLKCFLHTVNGGNKDGPPPAHVPPTTKLEYVYTTSIDDSLSTPRGEDLNGSVLASLYMWSEKKPWLLMQNLLSNERFRAYLLRTTGSSGDDWYKFATRNQGDDDSADRKLLNEFNGHPLVTGSNAERIREPECRQCSLQGSQRSTANRSTNSLDRSIGPVHGPI